MLDEERIKNKLSEFDSYIEELKSIVPKNYNEYAGSLLVKRSCERMLHILIESIIDICFILVAELKLGPPDEEESIIDKLNKKKVLSDRLAKKLRAMKKFRNILIHRYGLVDDKIVYADLKKNLSDFELFKQEILDFLKSQTK